MSEANQMAKQKTVGQSSKSSFDEAFRDAISKLQVPAHPSDPSDHAVMKIEITHISVEIGGFAGEPTNLSVAITASEIHQR